jgi:phosphate:Na+ symporter
MIRDLVFNLIGGLGLFLFGMRAMSEALQVIAGDRLRRAIGTATRNRFFGLGTGIVATMIVQSSSVTTVMVVSFVNAGLMNLVQAAPVVLGANIGTTITGWILVLQLHNSALLFLGVGVFLQFFSSRESVRFGGQFAAGFGMVFFGLSLMKEGFAPLKDLPEFAAWMARFGGETVLGLIASVVTGAVFTVLVQSSSVMLGITIALATVGLLSFQGAAALVLGENIGTTVTAQLAAVSGTTDARRTAMFHTTANVIGVLVMLLVFPLWLEAVDLVTPGDPNLIDAEGKKPFITQHIAVAHTSFNIALALVALPLLYPIIGLAKLITPGAARDQTHLQFLHSSMVESPTLALEQGRLELLHMAGVTADALRLTKELYAQDPGAGSDLRDRILKKERVTDAIQHEITLFMSRAMAGVLTTAQTEEIRSIIRIASEVESIADYCERLANYRRRMRRMDVQMPADAMAALNDYLAQTTAFYDEIIDRGARGETAWMAPIQAKGRILLESADHLRDENLARLAAQRCDPNAGIFFNDMLVAMRRIRNHSVNIAEAFQGKK